MIVECSCPGKLVLVGEYAVLFGHPAVVMAVDRRARVRLVPADDGRTTVVAPGLEPLPQELTVAPDGAVRWRHPSCRLPLVEHLLTALARDGLLDPQLPPFAGELDTRAFFTEGEAGRHKLGLGSSAALTVALASALATWSGNPARLRHRDWLRALVEVHREARGGRGSGIDVAASLLGGVVEYQLGERGEVAAAEPVMLPDELLAVYVWTGRSVDTSHFLERLERRMGRDNGRVEAALVRLGSVSGAAAEALHMGDAASLLEAVDAFWEGLDELGGAADLDILSEQHRGARQLVLEAGGTYKPSGAGGGDLGIALTNDPGIAAALERRLRGAGFEVMDLSVAATGCEVRSRERA